MNKMSAFEARNLIKKVIAEGCRSNVSCRTENDEDYERVICTSGSGYFYGSDIKEVEKRTKMHLNCAYVSPSGSIEFTFVRSRT